MDKRVSFQGVPPQMQTRGGVGPLPSQQHPPDVGMALGNVMERSFEISTGNNTAAPLTRRARKSLGLKDGAAVGPAPSVALHSGVHADPMRLEGVATGGFPKALPRPNLGGRAGCGVATESSFGGVGAIGRPIPASAPQRTGTTGGAYHQEDGGFIPAESAPVHVDRDALYSRALYGEGVTTLHTKRPAQEESTATSLSAAPNSLLSSTAPLTQDLTADELSLAGALVSSADVVMGMKRLLHTGSIDASFESAQPSTDAPPFLPSTLRLAVKLLRSPVSAHNLTGVKIIHLLCRHEPSAWVAVLWGGGDGAQKTVGGDAKSVTNTLVLRDNYNELHKYLTEAGQDPSAAVQAQLRFGALGTGGLLAQTTTASPFDPMAPGGGNSLEWPQLSSVHAKLDKESHQQLVYSFHKALSPARVLDTIINKNLRAACGYKRPCPNLVAMSMLLDLFTDGLLFRPCFDTSSAAMLEEVSGGGGTLVGVHPFIMAGVALFADAAAVDGPTAISAPATNGTGDSLSDGIDHDAVDEVLASAKGGDGNKAKALRSLGLVSVMFDHLLPLLKEIGLGEGRESAQYLGRGAEGHSVGVVRHPSADRRAALQVMWFLMSDPLVSAQYIVRDYILAATPVRSSPVPAAAGEADKVPPSTPPPIGYHARHYDMLMHLVDTFIMNDVLLAGLDPLVDGPSTVHADVSLVCSLLMRLCYGVVGVAVGSCFEVGTPGDGSASAAYVALTSIVLAKCADTVAVISALLDGGLSSDDTVPAAMAAQRESAALALLGLQQAVMQCYVYAAEMHDASVGGEGGAQQTQWSWAQSSGESFLQVCGGTVVGHLAGVSESGTRIAPSTIAASLLLKPFVTDGLPLSDGIPREHLLGPSSGDTRRAVVSQWIQDVRTLVGERDIVPSLLAATRVSGAIESSLAADFISALITSAVTAGSVYAAHLQPILTASAALFGTGDELLARVVRWVAKGSLLPMVDAGYSASDETNVFVRDAISSAALALQVSIVAEWQRFYPLQLGQNVGQADPESIICGAYLRLLLVLLRDGVMEAAHSAPLRETLLAEGVVPMLSVGNSDRTLVLALLTQAQLRLLDGVANILMPHSVGVAAGDAGGAVVTPTARQFCVLMCAVLSHPEHKLSIPPDVVAGYALVAGSIPRDTAGEDGVSRVFTGSDRLLFSLALAYLQRHHSLPVKSSDPEDDGESDTARERGTPFANVFAFRDPPLEWFYSEGQVYREAVLEEADEEDGDDATGAILQEESRPLLGRACYNERQGFAAWLLWLAGIIATSTRAGEGSVSSALLRLDELLVDVWLWRMRLASVGVSITPAEVAEYKGAVVPEAKGSSVASLHTIHVGEACDVLFAALVGAVSKAGGMRSTPFKKIVDTMPNITATLGFVPIPATVLRVANLLMMCCRPPGVCLPGEGTTLLSPSKGKEQRLRAQVFLSLTRLVCLVEGQQGSKGVSGGHSEGGVDALAALELAQPTWWSWNSQQYTDILVAAGPVLGRLAPGSTEGSSSLNLVLDALRTQLSSCAVPRALVQQQAHASSYTAYRWGAESSEAVWETIDELGLGGALC